MIAGATAQRSAGPAPFKAELDAAKEYTDRALSGLPVGLSEQSAHLRAGEGKFLRAGLLIASAMCGDYDRDRTLPLAAAVEILHLGSLVHDDIIDDADTRRGRPSLQKQFGPATAVFTGDYLFTLVFSLVSSHNRDRMEDVAKATRKICLGEIMQNRLRYRFYDSIASYIRIASGKTAALFAAAMYAGGKEGGLTEKQCRSLGRAGGWAGLMFQIVDDCLDLKGSAASDKPAFKDIAEGVTTLPALLALRENPALRELLSAAVEDPSLAVTAARAVLEAGGLDKAGQIAARCYEKARKHLSSLPDCEGRRAAEDLFERCYRREK